MPFKKDDKQTKGKAGAANKSEGAAKPSTSKGKPEGTRFLTKVDIRSASKEKGKKGSGGSDRLRDGT